MKHSGSTFLCGCGPLTDFVFFAKELDEFVEQDVVNSSFFLWCEQIPDAQNRWMKYDNAVEWRAIDFATARPGGGNRIAVAIGSNGQYFEVNAQSLKESLGTMREGLVGLRCVCSVEDTIYAAGMGRIVLKRISLGQWNEIGPGVNENEPHEVIGFEDIAGFSDSEIYVVGWHGEIWRFDGNLWTRIDTPTSGNFNGMTCAGDGNVYAVGDSGLMVRGRANQWEVLDTERPENLLDVAFYEDQVYVVTDYQILLLNGEQLIPIENLNDQNDLPVTCLHLFECDDGLVSLGPKDLFRLHNGAWERIV